MKGKGGYILLDLCPETAGISPDEIESYFYQECLYAQEFYKRIESIKRDLEKGIAKGNLKPMKDKQRAKQIMEATFGSSKPSW